MMKDLWLKFIDVISESLSGSRYFTELQFLSTAENLETTHSLHPV